MKGSVPAVGAGFLWSWLYCLWFSWQGDGASSIITGDDQTWLVSMALAATTQVILLRGGGWAQRFLSRSATCVGVGVLMTVLSGAFLLGRGVLPPAAIWVACLLNGVLSGALWVAWGLAYDLVERSSFQLAILASALVVLLCVGLSLALAGIARVVFIVALPLVSALFLVWMRKEAPSARGAVDLAAPLAQKARATAIQLGLAAFLACAVLYFARVALAPESIAGGVLFDGRMGIMVGAALIALLSLALLRSRSRRRGVASLQWLLWFSVVAIALVGYDVLLARFFLDIASFAIDFLVILCFALISRRGFMGAKVAFVLGESLVEFGFVGGYALGRLCRGAVDASMAPLVSACCVACMALLLMWLMRQQPNMAFLAAPSRLVLGDDERMGEVAGAHALSKRETEVFSYLAQGRTVAYISDTLFISTHTVDTHVKHIYAKLGVHSKQELIDMVSGRAPHL